MVAAWISALTGVGPSMASGSHICNGNMALLPAPPMNMSTSAVGNMKPPAATALATSAVKNGAAPSAICRFSMNEKLNDWV